MRGLGTSFPRKLLVLAVIVSVVFGELGLTVSSVKFLKHDEFQRSMSRYRHLLQAEPESMQEVRQENLEGQEPEKHVEEFRGEEQQVVRYEKKGDEIPNETTSEQRDDEKGDEISNETTADQQQVDVQKVDEQRDEQQKNDETSNETIADQQQSGEKVDQQQNEQKNDEIPNETPADQQQSYEKIDEEHDEQKNDGNPNETQIDMQQQFQPEKVEEELKKPFVRPESDPYRNEEDEPFVTPEGEPYLLGPRITDWDQQRARWLDQNPHLKTTGTSRVLLITGSQPKPCKTAVGDNFHLKALKNKMDYCRMHNYEIFYNFAFLDPLFNKVWAKLPIIRSLMLTHPEKEWILWMDSDAVFTDLLFEPPLESFEGSDMVMWSWRYGFWIERRWVGINDGVFYLRNCQWSLDLLDKWSPMGPVGPVRTEYGKLMSNFLTYRYKKFDADDQSALAYLVLTDEAVRSRVKFIEDEFKMSSYWVDTVDKFEEYAEKYHPGLGDWRWPWVTHFTGCSPCSGEFNPEFPFEMCMKNFERAYHFADNQVLAFMGLQHDSLDSSANIVTIRNETDRPIDWVDESPWAERIAQLAAGDSQGQ